MTITAVTNFQRYLGGQHRLASSFSDAALLPLKSPLSVITGVQISGQSLEAIACCAVESADRISKFACMWHAHALTAQPPAHSHLLRFQRRFVH